VLEAKKDPAASLLAERPACLDQPQETWNDEQAKAVKEFERKVKAFQEEREQARRTLEAEAKKLRAEIQAIVEGFDQRLQQLAEAKLDDDAEIRRAEMEAAVLLESLVREEDASMQLAKMIQQIENGGWDYDSAVRALNEYEPKVEEQGLIKEQRLGDEGGVKTMFQKEFKSLDCYHELNRLFTERLHPDLPAGPVAGGPLDPFLAEAVQEEDQEGIAGRPRALPLDLEDLPEGVGQAMAERMQELRERHIQLEAKTHKEIKKFDIMKARLNDYKAVLRNVEAQQDLAKAEKERLEREREADAFDLPMFLKLKQGQLEVSADTLSDDKGDAALVELSRIRLLNTAVVTAGKDKVEALKETLTLRRRIANVEWNNDFLDHKADEMVENTKFMQLIFVTKDLQAVIKGGDEDRRAAQIATLERQIEHSKKLHESKVEDLRKRLQRSQRQLREKFTENSKLDEYVQDLSLSVAQRDKILRVRETEGNDEDDKDFRMQEVVWRRLVLEEARQQSEDIAVLRSEVERLRQRTFPSFAKSYTARLPRSQQGGH